MDTAKLVNNRTYDAVIVGAGISGALIAHELVQAGKTVLMLEAGPDKTSARDRNILVENFYKNGFKTPESAYPEVPPARKATTPDLFVSPYTGYLDQEASAQDPIPSAARNDWFKSTYERRVGGTTWHWLGTCLRLVPGDFEMRTKYKPPYPGFVDWPISYKELRPWYTKAEAAIGVSGDPELSLGGANRKRADGGYDPFPMPRIPPSYLDKQFAKAVDGSPVTNPFDGNKPIKGFEGLKLEVESTPQARNSVGGYQDRPQCCGNSSCIPVCPIQAKYDATVHIKKCQSHYGNYFTLIPQAVADSIQPDQSGNISGVRFKKWDYDGSTLEFKDFVAKGKIYVLAAHAIETPKLLLNSANSLWPNGCANSSGAVGRYLMDHNTLLSYALTPEPVYGYRGPLATSGIESLKDNDAREWAGAFRVEIGNDAWSWPANAPYQQVLQAVQNQPFLLKDKMMQKELKGPIFGKRLADALQSQAIREVRMACLVEPTPMWDHHVSLSGSVDALGIPRPRIKYGITDDPYCLAGFANAKAVNESIFRKLNAMSVHHVPPQEFAGAGHIMGTTRMGPNSDTSVVNASQQSHDHKNLYMVGSSVFPTVGASNPTLTIAALSLWAAQSIKTQLGA